ncbi:glucokinase [Rhodocyclus tenuis]|uniref:Glucokinase n=1 Tax=Rhodocyclus tenuis TaxID=1066 RepID=A0A840GAC6_RHOTE|nr:glucokinase [Rhodocyclus tenuis]MBB4248431.1 glucokinase [Rhodocyclus tenuis]
MMLLGGDLGGTKTLLALAELRADGALAIVDEVRYASADWPDFAPLLADFRARHKVPVSAACFGLAGPVDAGTAKLTYLPWRLDAQALAADFALGRVALVNDFVAAASGIELLPANACATLQAGAPLAEAPRVVVGAGTGLGVAGVLRHADETVVVAGEGGHQGFSPQSAEQAALWQHLFAQHGRVTAEDIISGPGLARVHAFLGGGNWSPAAIGTAAKQHGAAGTQPKAGPDAVSDACPHPATAAAALSLWLSAYGAFAGDLALSWLARGGVYLAGGIAGKLIGDAEAATFLAAFNAKREHRALAEAMPVRLVREERLGLLGALAKARALLRR